MLFKGVLIGLELQEFDRMCAMRLVFPRRQKISYEVLTPDRRYVNSLACPGKSSVHVTC